MEETTNNPREVAASSPERELLLRALLLFLVLVFLLFHLEEAHAQSLDLAVDGYGLSIGNSKRISGIRINAVDRNVEEINGLNLTLWNPGKNPDAVYNGLAIGLIGTKSRTINGIAINGIGVSASEPNPAAEVSVVNSIGRNSVRTTSRTVLRRSRIFG